MFDLLIFGRVFPCLIDRTLCRLAADKRSDIRLIGQYMSDTNIAPDILLSNLCFVKGYRFVTLPFVFPR